MDGEKCNLDGINDTEDNERNKKVIANSEAIGADVFIEPEDITSGSKPLNLLHVAALMNAKTGLDPPDEKAAMEAAKLMEDDNEGSREERSYRMWVNSLGVTDGNISNLYEECKEAILLLK
ncbi:MAG: hypothetical protein MJ252_27425 [archaeon]|nr:hypothetical protein [archaeon]